MRACGVPTRAPHPPASPSSQWTPEQKALHAIYSRHSSIARCRHRVAVVPKQGRGASGAFAVAALGRLDIANGSKALCWAAPGVGAGRLSGCNPTAVGRELLSGATCDGVVDLGTAKKHENQVFYLPILQGHIPKQWVLPLQQALASTFIHRIYMYHIGHRVLH